MKSGRYILIIEGDNGDDPTDAPFAYQRDFTLQVGTQATITVSLGARELLI
jgi:hypothetical protein